MFDPEPSPQTSDHTDLAQASVHEQFTGRSLLHSDRSRFIESLRLVSSKGQGQLRSHESLIPMCSPLEPLCIHKGLRRGTVLSIGGSAGHSGATTLALATAVELSNQGVWCAALANKTICLKAASELGVDLGRFPVILDARDQWSVVLAALLETFELVLAWPPGVNTIASGDFRRLSSVARSNNSSLVFAGNWPGAELRWLPVHSKWQGLGDGHGVLTHLQLRVRVSGRRSAAQMRDVEVVLPAKTPNAGTLGAQSPQQDDQPLSLAY